MIVRVKLFAMLRDKLPAGSDGESVEVDMPAGATPRDVIERLAIPPGMAHLVMIEGRHLVPAEVRQHVLQPGEVLAIFPPIAGG